MHNRGSSGDQVARVTRYKNIVSQNVPESSSITTEDKNIILEAYSMPKLGSGGNFESRKSSLCHMVYLYFKLS